MDSYFEGGDAKCLKENTKIDVYSFLLYVFFE